MKYVRRPLMGKKIREDELPTGFPFGDMPARRGISLRLSRGREACRKDLEFRC